MILVIRTLRRERRTWGGELLAYAATFGTAFLARQGLVRAEDAEPAEQAVVRSGPVRRYEMKKSINLWAFPVS